MPIFFALEKNFFVNFINLSISISKKVCYNKLTQ